jgi:hypothetical protein
MTPEQCIQRLARRLGYFLKSENGFFRMDHADESETYYCAWQITEEHAWADAVDTTSIDALSPVLATMTEEEKKNLSDSLYDKFNETSADCVNYEHWLLTIDPQQLAFAIAEAMREEK